MQFAKKFKRAHQHVHAPLGLGWGAKFNTLSTHTGANTRTTTTTSSAVTPDIHTLLTFGKKNRQKGRLQQCPRP